MSLADDQKFLTRLLTDRNLLNEFDKDPEGTAEKAGFSRESARRLAQIPREQLWGSGRSLIQKRGGAVAKILPQSYKALGRETFQKLFREHAENVWPKGAKRHLADAIAFASFLEAQAMEPWIIDLARLESTVVAFGTSSRLFVAQRLQHHPASLRAAVTDQLPPPNRATLLIGLRFPRGQKVYWRAIPLALASRENVVRPPDSIL